MFLTDDELKACVRDARTIANTHHYVDRKDAEHMASMIVFHLIQRAVAQKKGEPDSAS